MTEDITDPCEYCGADPAGNTAFVRYDADPNDAQRQTEWFTNTPERLYALICMSCGLGRATIDPRDNPELPDFEDLPDGTSTTSDFRVDDTLE